jgi:hypothetical protein
LLLTRLAIGYPTHCTCYIISCIVASAVGPWSRGVCLWRHSVTRSWQVCLQLPVVSSITCLEKTQSDVWWYLRFT